MLVGLLAWLIVALVLALTGTLHRLPVSTSVIADALTAAILFVLALSPSLRARALAGGPRPLVALHLTRFIGFYFLWLTSLGLLARNFAVLAGWGEVIMAAWAGALLFVRDWRSREMRLSMLLWNAFGLFDILMVLAMVAGQAAADPGFLNGMASLPLSLLPTFIVPVAIASHVLLFAWLPGRRSMNVPERRLPG
jgi:hypothetical protein